MAMTGIILKNGLHLSTKVPAIKTDALTSQKKVLNKLLRRGQYTDFGEEYNFARILRSDDRMAEFMKSVPIHTYEKMFLWWKASLNGQASVTWPGKVDYFALSSGTSSGSSKYIPVTRAMLKAIQKGSMRQLQSLANCHLPESFYEKDIMMLGGSTSLDYNGVYYAGDLSGITTGNLPLWFQPFYRPGREISKTRNWQEKLDKITTQAHNWDVGAIVGSPSWFQILIERIIAHYKLKNIHELWPNLQVFTHGAVAFDPYKKSFEALLAHPLIYLETYLASEGFIAYQNHPDAIGMQMLLKNDIFYEFVPFNEQNIDAEGNILPEAETLHIGQVKEDQDYALLMTTCAGAWRYIIGDVIRFTDVKKNEIIIVGRSKHYLSLCGEHLSVDNMNKAIEMVSENMNISIKEFTVAGESENNRFKHHWYISTDKDVDKVVLKNKLDFYLKELNDDYRVERGHMLHDINVDILPNNVFINWLQKEGKEGAQIKFPRVLKGKQLESWNKYLAEKGEIALQI